MRGNYQITVDRETGIPCAHVDNEDVWELGGIPSRPAHGSFL